MAEIKTRIKLRHDTLANWAHTNIVLLAGELAIVDNGDSTRFKVGDGESHFNDLPFTDQRILSNCLYLSSCISANTEAISALSSDIPLSVSQLENDAKYSSVTIVDKISGLVENGADLSVIRLAASEYAELVAHGAKLSNCVYVVEASCIDAYGQQVKNVSPATDLSDAVTLEQLQDAVQPLTSISVLSSQISAKQDVSALTADVSSIVLSAGPGWEFSPSAVNINGEDRRIYAEYEQDHYNVYAGNTSYPLTAFYEARPTTFPAWTDYGDVVITAAYAPNALGIVTYDYLSAQFSSYKDYNDTVSSLSNDGYATTASLQTTLGSIPKSLVQQIAAPSASVNSILCALTQLLSILSGNASE